MFVPIIKSYVPGAGSVVVVGFGVVDGVVEGVVEEVAGGKVAPPAYGGQVLRSGICWLSHSVKWETSA